MFIDKELIPYNGEKYFSYNFGEHIIDFIDISVPQKNYVRKYSSDAIENQKELFESLNLEDYFDNRVIVVNSFETNILRIEDFSYSGYKGNKTKCYGYEGVITSIPKLPLFVGFGDCPQLMVIGNNDIGVVHATRDTLDNYILQKFFDVFSKNNNLDMTQIGFSPYIFPENFKHDSICLKRSDWDNAIIFNANYYFLDLKKMITKDLVMIGINPSKIKDLSINTYELSKESEKQGGYQISRRQASLKEGRGGLVLMLK